jgi:hypothetical protein
MELFTAQAESGPKRSPASATVITAVIAPVIAPADPPPNNETTWNLDRALYLLDPAAAEIVVLNLGLKLRRRHKPDEIAAVTSLSPSAISTVLATSYATLALRLKGVVAASEDRDLGILLARVAR